MDIVSLLDYLKGYSPKDKDLIIRGFAFAYQIHKNQKRKSGEEYIIHPVNVACILAEMHADADTITAGLLHDTIEDGENVTKEMIASLFNPTIADLVDGVTKMKKFQFDNDKQMTDEANMRKIVESITMDVRIFIIKLADRLHNMRTLEYQTPQKQKEKSLETMELFVPFAGLIGEYTIKCELEDLSFKYLDPDEYYKVNALAEEEKNKCKKALNIAVVTISQALNNLGINYDIKFKTKSTYQLYKKLNYYKNNISDVHDLFTIKILLPNKEDCYKVCNLIDHIYQPIDDKRKDYIGMPKTNLYSGLHTSVIGPENRIIQFQCKTPEMYKINAYGLIAYWDMIKNNNLEPFKKMQDDVEKMPFYKLLEYFSKLNISDSEFNYDIKNDILSPMIYIYLQNDQVIEITKESTILDLAYKVSDELGDSIEFAYLNGELVKPNIILHNKDKVDFIDNSKFVGPRPNYYDDCRTEYAKRKLSR